MLNWRIIDNTYLYDGSIKGFFSLIYECFKLKIIPRDIKSENIYKDNLLETSVFIESNENYYNYTFKEIKKISNHSLYKVHTAFLSGNLEKEIIIYHYLINLFKFKDKFNYMRNNEYLIRINDISAKVSKESHRMKGFLRFKEIYNNILYATIEPENNIIEILAKHFKERLKNEYWIIEDKRRDISIIYNKKDYIIVNSKQININNNFDEIYEKLWKDYYKNINIKERKNLRCQMNFMPKKYWKNLIEMGGNYD